MIKRGLGFFLCLALLAGLIVPVGAEQEAKFLHPVSIVEDSTLCLVGAPAEEGTVSVTAGGQSVPCTVSTLEASPLPVIYYCIIDQSSSFSNAQKQHQLRALKALNEAMRPDDSMVLYLMGEKLTFGEPLTTSEAQKKGIEQACVYSAKFTDLDASILSALEHISATRSSEEISCILLITDGLDNQQERVNQADVFQAIRSSGLSFYTISVVDPWADGAAQKNALRMADYAEQSLGGAAFLPSKDFNSPTCVEDAVSEIVARTLSSSVIRLDLSQLPITGRSLDIDVTWSKDAVRITETCTVDTALLPVPTVPTQPETTAATEPETTAATEPETTAATEPETTQPVITEPETTQPTAVEPEPTKVTRPASTQVPQGSVQKGNLTLILVAAGFLVVAVLVVLALILWRRQRDLEMAEFYEEDSEDEIPLPEVPETKIDFPSMAELNKRLDFKAEPPKEMPIPQVNIPVQKPAAIHGCRVKLVPEHHPEGAVEFVIGVNESVTLGRNGRSDIVLNETDTSLSSLHFELQWDSRSLHLRDRSSTNGTALNGVPLRPEVWARVEKKAVIQAGATKYTVLTEKK